MPARKLGMLLSCNGTRQRAAASARRRRAAHRAAAACAAAPKVGQHRSSCSSTRTATRPRIRRPSAWKTLLPLQPPSPRPAKVHAGRGIMSASREARDGARWLHGHMAALPSGPCSSRAIPRASQHDPLPLCGPRHARRPKQRQMAVNAAAQLGTGRGQGIGHLKVWPTRSLRTAARRGSETSQAYMIRRRQQKSHAGKRPRVAARARQGRCAHQEAAMQSG